MERNMSTINIIFIVQNMKDSLNNQVNFDLQLINYITSVLILQLFKIVLHIELLFYIFRV